MKGTIRLKLDGNVSRGWPALTEVRVEGKSVAWPVALTGGHASQLREIRLPHGRYAIRVNAEHHQPHTLKRTAVDASPVDLGTISLQARPRFLATVQREDGTPLGGAMLVDDFGKLLAKADALGQLEYETASEKGCFLPGRVAIEYPGLAGTRILIADPRRDFAAGNVTLGMGGILELTVKRPDDERFEIRVRVMEADREGEKQTPRTIAEKVISADSDRLRLEMLPVGRSSLKSVDDSGKPMPSSHLGVRYQGKALDYMVMASIGGVQGNHFRTGSNGIAILRGAPAGRYEIWATQYDGDDLTMGSEPRPPVASFYHSGGEQSVSVEADRFAPRNTER